MSDSTSAGSCFVVARPNLVIAVLLVLLGATSTGWVMTATRERSVAAVAPPSPQPVRQPVLPPVEAAPSGQVEVVEVIVAAKDLPVGTMLTHEELRGAVKVKKVPKDGLPPSYITVKEDLVDKRLARPIRAEETFNPQDLVKGGVITLPDGYDMVSLQLGVGQAAAGFVGPGSRVNVLATMRSGNKLIAFPLLVNMLVVAVDTQTSLPPKYAVSFAVKEKEALLLSLAKSRGCTLELMLRHPNKPEDSDRDYDIDKVIKVLNDGTWVVLKPQRSEPVEDVPIPAPVEVVPIPPSIEFAPAPRPVAVPIPPAGE